MKDNKKDLSRYISSKRKIWTIAFQTYFIYCIYEQNPHRTCRGEALHLIILSEVFQRVISGFASLKTLKAGTLVHIRKTLKHL